MTLNSLPIQKTGANMQPAKTDPSSKNALLKTTAGAMMISFSAVWVKLAEVPPTVSAFYRCGFGSLFLLAFLLLRRKKIWTGWSTMGLSLVAAIFFALDLYTWHRAIGYVGPGLATILGNFEVFLVPIAGLLLYGERITLRFILAVPLAILGLFMIVGLGWDQLNPETRTGILYGLATAVFYTGFLVSLRRLQSSTARPSATRNLMMVSVLSALYLAADGYGTGQSFAIPTVQSGISLISLGLFSQTIGWLLITHSLPRIPAAIAGLLLLLQPSLSFVWDVLFFGRETSPGAWAGVTLAIGAIYMGATGKRKSSPKDD